MEAPAAPSAPPTRQTDPVKVPAPTGRAANSPRPAPTSAPAKSAPTIHVQPPAFRAYTVKRGDTWESIAAKEMGASNLWQQLSRANPLMTNLKEGRDIKIPLDPSNIQGRPVAEAPTPVKPADGVIEYTVKSGDTLGGIARAHYGSTSYKDLIYQANRDQLESEDQLKIGTRLKLPPRPN